MMNAEKLKVLVLDDEPLIADSLAQVLNLFDYEATAKYDPVQGVEWLGTNSCDIVISDVVFGGQLSGIDLAIKLNEAFPRCKVLLMSGNNSTADLLAAAQQKGHSFDILAKPVHPSIILEHLKSFSTSA